MGPSNPSRKTVATVYPGVSPSPPTGMTRSSTLALYRQILRTASRWPSVKRSAVIEEIRSEFRANRSETEAAKVEGLLAQAHTGLTYLRSQTGLGKASGSELSYHFDAGSARAP